MSASLRRKLIAFGHVTDNPIAGTSEPYIDPSTGMAPAQPTAAPAPASPLLQSLQSIPTSNPVFANEAERNIAINAGAYDPAYPSPLQKTLANSYASSAARDSDALIATRTANNPMMSAKTPADILAAQLAGDRDGTIKKIILAHQPTPLSNDPNQTGPVAGLHPYMGSIAPNATGVDTVAPLDKQLIHNEHFAKVYAKDPKEGMRIYKALTGRDMLDDKKETEKLIEHHEGFERDTFEKNIANGAKYDTTTQTWHLRQSKTMDDTGMNLGIGAAKPSEFRPATPIENAIMNRHYKSYVNGELPQQPKFGNLMTRNAAAVAGRAATDPGLKKLLTDRATIKGSSLNPAEVLHTVTEYDEQQAGQALADHPSDMNVGIGSLQAGPGTTSALKKLHDVGANILGFKSGDAGDRGERNMFGNFLDETVADPKKKLIDPALIYGH